MRKPAALLCVLVGVYICSLCAAQKPGIVVVEGTFTVAKSASEGPAARQFCDKVENALESAGIPFTLATEEQVEGGVLEGHKLAIFPYSAHWSPEETAKTGQFIKSGGKVVAFYIIPTQIADLLGLKGSEFRRQSYEGEFSQMRFADDRPAGFPAVVRQTSRNMTVRRAGPEARSIATWHDLEGKSTGTPAVILSANGLYMSHVLHEGNSAQQATLLLGAAGHFLPGLWQQAVEGSIAAIPRAAEVASVDLLEAMAQGRPQAQRLYDALLDSASRARQMLSRKAYEEALEEARYAQDLATKVVAATYGSRDGELRGVWHGGGVNKDWDHIMSSLSEAGFNAIFPCMSTGNHAYYPSDALPRTGDRDEMALCLKAAHKYGIEVHVWRINWAMLGGAPQRRQQFVDEGRAMVGVTGRPMSDDPNTGRTVWMCPSHEGNRQIEKQAMLELTRKYHPAGIHFDYMRYPSRDYCYCSRCRKKFEQRIGKTVANWPADCFTGGALFEDYKAFRKDLQTSLVRQIVTESRQIDPAVKISLAARSALPGAPENDGQDWPTWCKQGLLDFVCPMDYTGHDDERLKGWLDRQLPTIEWSVPLYAGLGVTYKDTSLANAVRACKQIKIARDQGGDGFLVFCYNTVFERFAKGLKLGATGTPVTVMPHHHPGMRMQADIPDSPGYLPQGVWPPGAQFEGEVRIVAPPGTRQMTLRCEMQSPDGRGIGGTRELTVQGRRWHTRMMGGGRPGAYWQWVATGQAQDQSGAWKPFILRSPTWKVAAEDEMADYRAKASPPEFVTDKPHVGVAMDGYGASTILQALQAEGRVEGLALYRVTADHLAACDAAIIPQRHTSQVSVYEASMEAIRAYVRGGGGVMVTHDAVGMRQHAALFPGILTGGPDRAPLSSAVICSDHPLTAGLSPGTQFEHSYADHIPVVVTGKADTVVKDTEGNAVVVAAVVGKGRLVANGMCTGLGDGDRDVPPEGPELAILVNAARWLANK